MDYFDPKNYYFNTQNASTLCHGYAVRELNVLPYVAMNELMTQGDKYFGQLESLKRRKISPSLPGRLTSVITDRTFNRILKFFSFTYAGNLLSKGSWKTVGRKCVDALPGPQDIRNARNPKSIGTYAALTFDYSVQTVKNFPQFIFSTGKLAAKTASLIPIVYKQHQWGKKHGPSLTDSYGKKVHESLPQVLKYPTTVPDGVIRLILELPASFFEAIASNDAEGAVTIAKMRLWKFGLRDNAPFFDLVKIVSQILSDPQELFKDKDLPQGALDDLLLQKELLSLYYDRTRQYDEVRLLLNGFLGSERDLPKNTLDILLLALPRALLAHLKGQTAEASHILKKSLGDHGLSDESLQNRILSLVPFDDPEVTRCAKKWDALDHIEEKRHELAAAWANKMRVIEKELWPDKEASNTLLSLSPAFFVASRDNKKKQARKIFEQDLSKRGVTDPQELETLWKTLFEGLKRPNVSQTVGEGLALNQDFEKLQKQLIVETKVLASSLNRQPVKEPMNPIARRAWRSGTGTLQGIVALAGLLPYLRFSSPPEGEQFLLDQTQFENRLPVRIDSIFHRVSDWVERSADWAIKGGVFTYGGWKLFQFGDSVQHSIRHKKLTKEKFGGFFENLHLYAMTIGSQDLVPSFVSKAIDNTFPNFFHKTITSEDGVTPEAAPAFMGVQITPEKAARWALQAPAVIRAVYDLSSVFLNTYRARKATDDEQKMHLLRRKVQNWNSFKKFYGVSMYNYLVLPMFKMHAHVTASGLRFGLDSYQFGIKNAWHVRQLGLENLRSHTIPFPSCGDCNEQQTGVIKKTLAYLKERDDLSKKDYRDIVKTLHPDKLGKLSESSRETISNLFRIFIHKHNSWSNATVTPEMAQAPA